MPNVHFVLLILVKVGYHVELAILTKDEFPPLANFGPKIADAEKIAEQLLLACDGNKSCCDEASQYDVAF